MTAANLTLEVKSRDLTRKAQNLRKAGLLPVEYYGEGVKNRSLEVDYQAFRKLFRIAGTNTIIELVVDGGERLTSLVHDVQYHPVTDVITHVDFIHLSMDKEIKTKINLEFIGMSLAVKDLSGILIYHLDEIDVKCLPKDLVHSIQVSVEPIVDFHSYIRVKDLVLPAGIKVFNNPEDVVVTAVPPRIEEEEVKPAATAEVVAAEGEAKAASEQTAETGKEKEPAASK